ncbi:MAG: hypothetical protein ACOCVX_03095 [Bacteroidales bacterium]
MDKNKEISIVELYKYVKTFLKRWWTILLLALIAGAVVGFYKSGIFDDRHQSNITISSEVISKNDLYSVFLPMMDDNNNISVKMLKPVFGDDDNVINNVEDLRFDTTIMKNAMVIRFVVSDTNIIEKMSNSIGKYIESSLDYKKQFQYRQEMYTEYLSVLNEEIEELNKYQNHILNNLTDVRNNSDRFVLTGSHSELIELWDKKYEIQRELNEDKPIDISANMQAFPVQNNLLTAVIMWSFVFIILTIFILILIEIERVSRKS